MAEILDAWRALLRSKPAKIVLADAENGERYSIQELDTIAEGLLDRYPALRDAEGRVLAFHFTSRVDWLAAYLAGLKVGAVLLPVELSGAGELGHKQFEGLGVGYVLSDAGLEVLPDAGLHPGQHLIKLTSGTTGAPKPLYFSEAGMYADGDQVMRSMDIRPDDRNYAILPLGHSYGLGNLVVPLLIAGTPIVLASAPFPQVMAEEISRYQCTVLPLVPTLVQSLAQSEIDPQALGSLRTVISAGSLLSPEVAQAFYERFGVMVHNFYGSSETGGICYDTDGEATLNGGGVGQAMADVRVRVDEAGGIFVQSAAVCQALAGDEGFQMSDFGEWGTDGSLRLVGRKADFVKIGGKRVSLSEVEQALCRLEGVEDAYVSQRPTRRGQPRLLALVVSSQTTDCIREALRRELPDWKLPKRFYTADTIPYTSRGKKDRKRLEQLLDAIR
ncbi:class I adenylate-forming enzyme family protein [Coraliomargarita parva]|uniref:class I adenylate-forming enzyme family protein n=1 Tax=Coraliomargarita parva TaxID=3014050 RepID=UPI0022B3791D|nr:class I adenylate-forming enzyme family protein [Coraliomargarita parva]